MPTLDDLPIIPSLRTAVAGNDLIPAYDVSSQAQPGVSGVKSLTVSDIRGLGSGEVTTVSGTSATISTPMTVCTSTSGVTLTLPAASGTLRRLFILKASITSAITVNRAGSDLIVSGTAVNATSISVAAGLAAILVSDGTTWYHVSNDA